MLKKKLRHKILAGALGLVLMVSLASTVVVSIIVERQNLNSVNLSLNKSLSVIRDAIVDMQNTQLDNLKQMITLNKIGENVKFIIEFATNDLSIKQSTFEQVDKVLLNSANTSGLSKIAVYDGSGNLQSFVVQGPDGDYKMGFYAEKQFYFKSTKKGEDVQNQEWQKSDQLDDGSLSAAYGSAIHTEDSAWIDRKGNELSIKTATPIMANFWNSETDKMDLRQCGFAVAVKKMSTAFASRMNRLTGMGINVFAHDRFSVGDNPEYRAIDLTRIPQTADGSWQLDDRQSFILDEIELEDQRYFQGILPLYNQSGYAGGIAVLQSDDGMKANNRQMIVMLSIVSASCMALAIPLAFFFSGKIVRPIITIVDRLKDISEGEGDLTRRLEVKSRDEIGQVADLFNTFIDKIHAMIKRVAENSLLLNDSASSLSEISKVMSNGAEQASTKANTAAAAGEEMSTNMTSVAAAMEQAATNVGMVASAAEEMSKTIDEISGNTVKARDIASNAVNQADDASGQVGELGEAANEIGKVASCAVRKT